VKGRTSDFFRILPDSMDQQEKVFSESSFKNVQKHTLVPESSSSPPGFITCAYDFYFAVFFVFSFFHSCYNLNFSEFGPISGDDFLSIDSYQVEFHPYEFWEPVMEF
jgi:hypothetical protein